MDFGRSITQVIPRLAKAGLTYIMRGKKKKKGSKKEERLIEREARLHHSTFN